MPNLFRKKPVIVEAIQFTDETVDQLLKFIDWKGYWKIEFDGNPVLKIYTLEGKMTATKGDWIIKGIKGECYPCKLDIFEATYEVVENV